MSSHGAYGGAEGLDTELRLQRRNCNRLLWQKGPLGFSHRLKNLRGKLHGRNEVADRQEGNEWRDDWLRNT